jgi:hypothetical protein
MPRRRTPRSHFNFPKPDGQINTTGELNHLKAVKEQAPAENTTSRKMPNSHTLEPQYVKVARKEVDRCKLALKEAIREHKEMMKQWRIAGHKMCANPFQFVFSCYNVFSKICPQKIKTLLRQKIGCCQGETGAGPAEVGLEVRHRPLQPSGQRHRSELWFVLAWRSRCPRNHPSC